MKTSLIFVIVAATLVVAANVEFDNFLAKYNKHYTGLEYQRRLGIFTANVRKAASLNAEQGSEVFGVTKFMDLSDDEFRSQYLMPEVTPLAQTCLVGKVYAPRPAPSTTADIPAAFDWRDTPNVVLSVKNQESCGGCWAFSTVAAMEGQNGIHNTAMAGVDLSPQFVIDCSKGCSSEYYHNKNTTVCNTGCGGGWAWTAFNDIATAIGGVPSQTAYPFKGVTGKCSAATGDLTKLTSYTCVSDESMTTGVDENVMAADLVNYGPLSIALNANYFNIYRGGIMDIAACDGAVLDHVVLAVGYGHDDASGKDYWIVKNQWGTSWGEDGYIRIVKGKGMCGINEGVVYPNL